MGSERRNALNAWILEQKAAGLWVTYCPGCGWYFAQRHMGRPAMACQKYRCQLWRAYQQKHNHAPPEWLRLKWEYEQGDSLRPTRVIVATFDPKSARPRAQSVAVQTDAQGDAA